MSVSAADRTSGAATLWYILRSSGVFLRRVTRSVWVHGASPAQFFAARPLIERIMRDRLHTRLVATSTSPATIEYLAQAFPDEQALPIPWESAGAIRRFLTANQPGIVLILDAARTFGPALTDHALRSGVPVAVLLSEPAARIASHMLDAARRRPGQVVFCVTAPGDAERLIGRGVAPRHVHVVDALAADHAHASTRPSPATIRRILDVPDGVPLVMAADVPSDEESLVLDAFQRVRAARPDARLVLEPRRRRRAGRLAARTAAIGWTCHYRINALAAERLPGWDVLLAQVPGELSALLPGSSAILVGGSWSDSDDAALTAIARATGCPVLASETPADRLASTLVSALSTAPRSFRVDSSSAVEKCLTALRGVLPDSPALPPVAQAWRVPTLRERGGASRLWHAVAPLVRGARYDDVDALRTRLKHPRTILCLGNGPSSEQPELATIPHDCLMRVNWRWKHRGLLTRPDVVLVGDPSSIQRLSDCIFGVWTIEMEYGMLLRNFVTRGLRRMECVTLERISPLIRDRKWPGRPTNGALMIVLAAALQPERLIVAGIDLFAHPNGRYPGDVMSSNQYSRVHERETDLALIRLALDGYRGETVILSDALRESLGAHAVSA